jgi:hypothetical protein
MTTTMCRHCQTRNGYKARSLCYLCERDADVRAMYPLPPPVAGNTNRGVCLDNVTPPPCEPTGAAPGTWSKVDVLASRAEAGVALWSPGDVRITPDDADAPDKYPHEECGRGNREPDCKGRRLLEPESGCRRVRVLRANGFGSYTERVRV